MGGYKAHENPVDLAQEIISSEKLLGDELDHVATMMVQNQPETFEFNYPISS
jgi:hypothetical protein